MAHNVLGWRRFGQIGLGILKIITLSASGIWALVDWIVALTKLSKYKDDFVFVNKQWADTQEEKKEPAMQPQAAETSPKNMARKKQTF